MNTALWEHDRSFDRKGAGLAGVDEAGRGCLAGPVYAAAVYLPEAFFATSWNDRTPPRIDDSKKLSLVERNSALEFIQNLSTRNLLKFSIGVASVEEIESENILGATTLAMGRALGGLNIPLSTESLPLWTQTSREPPVPVLIDGRPVKNLDFTHEALVQGDGKSLAIALASIVAKVERDRWMSAAHKKFSAYGWDRNKGYGTKIHRDALLKNGPTPLHRKIFLRKILGETK